jgi:hypothetical protein
MSFANLPPGLSYLAQATPNLAFPPLLVFVVHYYAPYRLPNYIWIIAYLLATPLFYIVYGVLRHIQEELEIRKLGARRVPQVPSSWPGGLDVLLSTLKSFTEGYPGMLSSVPAEPCAPMYLIRRYLG